MKRITLFAALVGTASLLAACGGADAEEDGPIAPAYGDGGATVLEVQPYGGCQQMVDDDGCGPGESFTVDEAGEDLVDAVIEADLDALVATGPGPCAAAADGISYEFTVHPPDGEPVSFDTCSVDLAASDQELARLLLDRYGHG